MHGVLIPRSIKFGEDALGQADYPAGALIVTTAPPSLSDKWISRMGIKDYSLFDKVTPEPSIEDVKAVVAEYSEKRPSAVYDGDYDGVVRIFVGLSCELGRLISYLINYIIIYITWNNFSPTRSVMTVPCLQGCN